MRKQAAKAPGKAPAPGVASLRQGMDLFNAGRYAEACVRFEAALKDDPASTSAAVSLAHALQFSGDSVRALKVVEAFAKKNPKDAGARRGLADILSAQGRLPESAAAYEKAVAASPKDAGLRLSLARVYMRLREPAKAEPLLRAAVEAGAGAEASLLLGELLKEKGLADEAAPFLKKAAAATAAAGDKHGGLAAGINRFRALVELGDYKKAFLQADALIAEQGTQDCLDSFFISPPRDKVASTLEALKKFAAENPKNSWPRYFRTTLFTNMGRGEDAGLESERLKDAPAAQQWMRHRHGEILLNNRRDYAGAEAEYEAALACVPGFWKARAVLAEIALCRGDAKKAVAIAGALIDDAPERVKAWGRACRGRLLLWSGDYARALEDLDAAAGAGVPDARRWRAGALILLGRLDEAVPDLEQSLAQNADAESLTWRAELRRLRGDHEGAIEDAGAAMRRDGANSFWALANRALARGASGDAAGQWTDYASIRRDVLDRFEKAAGKAPAGPEDAATAAAVLEAGLTLGRGVRVSNEYVFPVWMGR